jgi:thiosulfate reductase cytochrome b subunit
MIITLEYTRVERAVVHVDVHLDRMRHQALVRVTHWINALTFVALAVSGAAIVVAHPRFYWGETGYFDTPAAFELPLKVNLDQTGWGRNLHFLAAWVTVLNGCVYVAWGLLSRHFQHKLLPTRAQSADPSGYNFLQRFAYLGVVFGLFPVVILSGLTLSPAITAAYPGLFTLFAGRQSARTIHFIVADFLLLFLVIHVAMTIRSGFVKNVRSMIVSGEIVSNELT